MKKYVSIHNIFLFIAFFGWCKVADAQIGGGLEANYILGFGSDEIILGNTGYQTDAAHGYGTRVFGFYHFDKSNIDVIFKVGFKQLFISGANEDLSFTGTTEKITIALGGRYYITPKFSAALFWEMENNLDFEFFRTQTNDLFRHQLILQADYYLTDRVSVFASFSGAFYPIFSQYIIYNPQYQIGFGAAFNLRKS